MPAPDPTQLPPLAHPYQPLILKDGQLVTIEVRSWARGSMVIRPRDGRPAETIAAIRLEANRPGKPQNEQHYDVNQSQLIATIEPFLESGNFVFGTFTIRAQGAGIRKTFSVEVSPPPPPPAAERFA
jgi:hypothetical protein